MEITANNIKKSLSEQGINTKKYAFELKWWTKEALLSE